MVQIVEKKENKNEKLLKGLFEITMDSAHILFKKHENADFPIEYIRIDDTKYTKPETMGEDVIEHSKNIRKALSMVRNYSSIKDHKEHIDPFIIKYHPAWIFLREANGFNHINENEIAYESPIKVDTYMHFMQDNFIATGVNIPLDKNINPSTIMSLKIFNNLFDQDALELQAQNDQTNHPDFVAFRKIGMLKLQIDDYNNGIKPKSFDTIDFKELNYILDENGFPLLTVGRGKKRQTFDFRNPDDYDNFYLTVGKNKQLVKTK